MKAVRIILMPGLALSVTLLIVWYLHLPAPVVESNMAQVEREAADGGYRLIDVGTLSALYQKDREKVLLVDTRQEWEHRAGHIAGSVNFPMEPTWWARWQRKGALKALLGPHQGQTLVFY